MSTLLSIVAAIAPLLTQAPTDPVDLDGLNAPAGTWHVRGGSAAHNGSSLTEIAEIDPQLRWQHTTKGEISDEPLVWKRRVFVPQKLKPTQRSLEIIDLITGERLAEKSFRTSEPLSASVWEDTIALRATPDTIHFYKIAGDKKISFTRIGSVKSTGGVGSPLLYHSEAYIPTAEGLMRVTPTGGRVVWTAPGHFVGSVSLMGDYVYAVLYKGINAKLAAYERSTGRLLGLLDIGHHDGAIPPPKAASFIALAPSEAKVNHAYQVFSFEGNSCNQSIATLSGAEPKEMIILYQRDVLAAYGPEGWLEFMQPATTTLARVLVRQLGSTEARGLIVANEKWNSEFARPPISTSRAGSTYLIGALGIGCADFPIRWSIDAPVSERAIPATDCVLLRTSPTQLSAYGSLPAPQPIMAFLPPGTEPTDEGEFALGAITGLRSDGSSFDGKYSLSASKDSLFTARRRASNTIHLSDVAYVENQAKRPLFMSGVAGMVTAMTQLFEDGQRDAYLNLAHDARKSKDPKQLQRLLNEARRRGAQGKQVKAIEKTLATYLKSPPRRPVTKQVAAIEAREAQLQARRLGPVIYERVTALGSDLAPLERQAMLRAVLADDPHFAPAVEEVTALVEVQFKSMGVPPESFLREALDLTTSKDDYAPEAPLASDWLEFLGLAMQTDLSYIAPVSDAPATTADQHALNKAANRWREDLFMLRSPHMQVISPTGNPGQIARCIRLGEAVSDMLEKELAPFATADRDEQPMTVYLYTNEAEYSSESLDIPGPVSTDLLWQSGHYSQKDEVQHMFLHDGPEAFEQSTGSLTHEFIHNWMARRHSLHAKGAARPSPDTPGFWLVEGLAGFFEEFEIDMYTGEYRSEPAHLYSLDVLVNSKLIQPWKGLVKISRAECEALDYQRTIACQLTGHLGVHIDRSAKGIFHMQAAATARYLYFADDGAHRAKLFAAVKAYYTNDVGNTNIAKAVGMSPRQLGRAVLKLATGSLRGIR